MNVWPCRLCDTLHAPADLGEHYRTKHGMSIHGTTRRKVMLPDNVLTALCDGAVRAQQIIASEGP